MWLHSSESWDAEKRQQQTASITFHQVFVFKLFVSLFNKTQYFKLRRFEEVCFENDEMNESTWVRVLRDCWERAWRRLSEDWVKNSQMEQTQDTQTDRATSWAPGGAKNSQMENNFDFDEYLIKFLPLFLSANAWAVWNNWEPNVNEMNYFLDADIRLIVWTA